MQLFMPTINNTIMSGIVNLFVPASSFVSAIFVSNEEMTQICFAGLMTGEMLPAYTSIGNQNSAFFGQAKATLTSGSYEEEEPETNNKIKFTVKAPKKSTKVINKQALGAKVQEIKFNPLNESLKRPDNIVFKPPISHEPVGIVARGKYTMTQLPWPSTYKIYLAQNHQWSGGYGLVYEYRAASNDPNDVPEHDAVFDVYNFSSKGDVYTYDHNLTFKLSPSKESYFDYEIETEPPSFV